MFDKEIDVMKVLWLCNIILPMFSRELNESVNPFGGWLTGLLDKVSPHVDIAVCFPYSKGNPLKHGKVGLVSYYGYKETKDNTELFSSIIKAYSPDIIHIWGTEFKHTLDMVNASKELGLIDRVVIDIQGLVSVIGKYHYYCGIPEKVYKSASRKERKEKSNIERQKISFEWRGITEIKAIQMVKNVMGRTDWDEACTKQINPSLHYYHCDRSLRSSFYEKRWNIEHCQKHSIFVSQSNYPVKGFHLMLEAMPIILKRFPDAHLYTTGDTPTIPESWRYYLTYSSYSKYIRDLIDKYKLEQHVSFVGTLDEKGMCERYLQSNVFVSPSSIENSSNSVGEAMILGLPVVSSDVGGIKNLMEHNKEGYIYQQDAPYMLAYYVCKVFEDDDKAVKMGINAREHALKTHNRDNNLHTIISIYEELISKG